uniref:Reverse transcriptase domain-containing protein n=1 Tax=Tanacetum cinerariifolium TaxID=118510 RepID=A0A6L2JLY0_TANCI|nr:hypothetical protein [Tanacetum cinerariifolium]
MEDLKQHYLDEMLSLKQPANLSTHTSEPSRRFNSIYYDDDDDDEEKTIPLRDIISQLPLSIVITNSPPVLPTFKDPEDSIIIGNKDLRNIPEKESDEFIKSSVEDFDPIPNESENKSRTERLLEETDDVLGLTDGIKSYPAGIVRNVEVYVGKLKLFANFYVVDMEREPTCPLLVGRGFLATANAVIDCKKAKITEDLIENPINWNKPPKEGDGAWHIMIELIDTDGEKFDRAFQSIPTNRRLSLKEKPSDILNLDHFHDS